MTFRQTKREEQYSALKQLTDPIEEYGTPEAARRGAVDAIDWVCENVPPVLCLATDNLGRGVVEPDGEPLYWVTPLTLINTILSEYDDRIQMSCSDGIDLVVYETSH
jgi:hypothetical protein